MISEVDYIISIGDCCVSAEFCSSNGAKNRNIGAGLIFDWAESNIECVCDITQNGLEWYLENIIDNEKVYETEYKFKKLFYPHHKDNREYKKTVAERYFSILEQDNISVLFLYMSDQMVLEKDLVRFEEIIKNKYKINYKIVAAISTSRIIYNKINENIDLFECVSPQHFYNNKMIGNDYYPYLFKQLIPYNLNKLKRL
jgi:hypothetical protein